MQDTSRNDRSLELRFVRTASKISRWNLNAFEGVLHLHLYIVYLTRKKKLSPLRVDATFNLSRSLV